MNLKSVVAHGVIVSVLTITPLGYGAVPAYAQPAGQPGYIQDHPNRPHDDDDDRGDRDDRRESRNDREDRRERREDDLEDRRERLKDLKERREDREDRRERFDNPWHYDQRPPWGWGPPPRAEWRGPLPDRWGPPPESFDYWGNRVQPVWDDRFQTWGFWLFGIWIPLASIG